MKGLLFDLDGTLLNTIADLHQSTNFALRNFGYPEHTLAEIQSYVGDGLRMLILRALPSGCDDVCIDRVLAEMKINVRELTVGILDGKTLPIVEIIHNEGFYDYKRKYGPESIRTAAVAVICDTLQDQIREYSMRLVRALGIRDIARVDYFLSGDKIYFNEINTMPGMTKTSLYPKMIEASGITL